MPRITISHDNLVRIAYALIADSVRRTELGTPMDLVVVEQNDAIVNAITKVRVRDGLLPIVRKRS